MNPGHLTFTYLGYRSVSSINTRTQIQFVYILCVVFCTCCCCCCIPCYVLSMLASATRISVSVCWGSATAQAVSRRPLIAEASIRSRVSPSGICGGQSGTGTGFSPEYFGFPLSVLFHRCSITLKNKKKLITFIAGLHNKPLGCGASVASSAGPFTTKQKCVLSNLNQ
jgi:hypothetical protein